MKYILTALVVAALITTMATNAYASTVIGINGHPPPIFVTGAPLKAPSGSNGVRGHGGGGGGGGGPAGPGAPGAP